MPPRGACLEVAHAKALQMVGRWAALASSRPDTAPSCPRSARVKRPRLSMTRIG